MEWNIINISIYREKITFQSSFQSIFLWNVMECYGMRENKAISMTYYQWIIDWSRSNPVYQDIRRAER